MTKPSRWALALACTLASLATAPAALAAGGLREVTVDASHPTGVIRSLQGVSGSPLPGDASHPDFTAQQRQMGVDLVRTHDIDCKGTGDITASARTGSSATGAPTRTIPPATTSAPPTGPS
jgi:hypothetical protein